MDIKYSTNNNGETYIKIFVGSQTYTIRGYSRAGLRTCICIDELNVVFDMGYANERAFSFDNKLISHGHNDHIGALHIDHCTRKLNNIIKKKLFMMPRQCIKPFKIVSTAISEMNCGRSGENIKFLESLIHTDLIEAEFSESNYYNLIGSSKIESEYWVRSFQMDHKIKSFGYIVYRKSKKLKSEYIGLKPHEIMQIKKKIGESNLTYEVYTPLVGYTGDTTINGILYHEEFLTVPLLIMECTGFSPEDDCICCEGKHIHINDLVLHNNLFQNKKIVLFHFSQQYRTIDQILTYCSHIPESLMEKISFFF
jgi:ribonuclease BN (tRNA processing enzyme)